MTQISTTARRRLLLPFIIFLALIITSCASTWGENKKPEEFKDSIDAFNSAFRWEEYKEAAAFVPPDKKEEFWAQVDKFKGKIRITDFEVRETQLKDKNPSATAILHLQYWRTESPTLQTVTFTQKWYYNAKEKKWMVVDHGFGAITRSGAGF